MRVVEIRWLDNGQYEIDVEHKLTPMPSGAVPLVEKTYRSNQKISSAVGYKWTRLPDVILIKDRELQKQLNAWLYDWLQQQKGK